MQIMDQRRQAELKQERQAGLRLKRKAPEIRSQKYYDPKSGKLK
jgi:hypothetical protein